MVYSRRALVALTASVMALSWLAPCVSHAARSKAKVSVRAAGSAGVGSTKVSVPAYIIKGSAITGGRAFYKSALPESTLANIRLGRPAKEILSIWGNPSRITVGSVEAEVPRAMPTGGPMYVPPGGNPYSNMGANLDIAANMLNVRRSPLGGLPSLPGLEEPGAMPGALPGGVPGGGETSILSQEEVTWTYDLSNGITLEFIITDGTITQITVGGVGPWGLSRTRTGLQLGDSYKLILWVCGYPESQRYAGRFLRVSYVDKSRVLFTLLNKKLVGVTIALVQEELAQY